MFKKIELQEGVTLYIRKSEQFKTVNFSVKWKTALDEKKAAHRAVLANVLQDSNGQYRTQSAFRNTLDEMYGTVLIYGCLQTRRNTYCLFKRRMCE